MFTITSYFARLASIIIYTLQYTATESEDYLNSYITYITVMHRMWSTLKKR